VLVAVGEGSGVIVPPEIGSSEHAASSRAGAKQNQVVLISRKKSKIMFIFRF
jgi:hypothetical protein